MSLIRKSLLATITLALLCFASSNAALADTITATAPSSGNILVPPFTPSVTTTIGTFTYTIPGGQEITSANLSGFAVVILPFGGSASLFLDGQGAGSLSSFGFFNISLANSLLPLLADGSAVFSVTAFSGSIPVPGLPPPFGPILYPGGGVFLGETTLTIQTALSPTVPGVPGVPEPTTMLLLGTGLAGIAAKVRKRRKAGKSVE